MMKGFKNKLFVALALMVALMLSAGCGGTKETAKTAGDQPIRIGIVNTMTGPMQLYGVESVKGFKMGMEYATKGTNKIGNKTVEILVEDSTTNPEVAKQKGLVLLDEKKVDILVGSASSADALSLVQLAGQYKKPLVVDIAIADSITGKAWNRYVFRTARNNSQDAVAWAGIFKKGDKVAILSEDYSMGRDGAKAFKDKLATIGGEIVYEEYAPGTTADFTPYVQGVIAAKPNYLILFWASANNPTPAILKSNLKEKGINFSFCILDPANLEAIAKNGDINGVQGFSPYFYSLPKNPINDWLVTEYKKRNNDAIPGFSAASGFTAAMAVVEAFKQTNGVVEPEKLVSTMEGMSFDSPKGKMNFRKEDHQALQPMYSVRLEKKEGQPYPLPVLVKEFSAEETAPPVQVKK